MDKPAQHRLQRTAALPLMVRSCKKPSFSLLARCSVHPCRCPLSQAVRQLGAIPLTFPKKFLQQVWIDEVDMNCPYCGKSIQDESVFCMHCGNSISKSIKDDTFNSRFPAVISELAIWLESGMEYVEIRRRSLWQVHKVKRISRKITYAFQLMDDSHEFTTYAGQVTFQINWGQYVYGTYTLGGSWSQQVERGSINNACKVNAGDFYRAKNDKLYCKIICPEPLIINPNYDVEGTMQLWFMPKDTTIKLYGTDKFLLSPTK